MIPESKPTKEQLRQYLYDRRQSNHPPQSPEEIKRALGWHFKADRSR